MVGVLQLLTQVLCLLNFFFYTGPQYFAASDPLVDVESTSDRLNFRCCLYVRFRSNADVNTDVRLTSDCCGFSNGDGTQQFLRSTSCCAHLN